LIYSSNNLEKILNKEIDIFNKIYKLENIKTNAIIERDGKLLESLARQHEKHLSEIESLETNRTNLTKFIKNNHKVNSYSKDITLKDIAALSDNSSVRLLSTGKKLKNILMQIKHLQNINQKLLDDNMEFYNSISRELKNLATQKSGYTDIGSEKTEVINSLYINKKI